MKALTLIQPWASLIADGKKRVETRSWGTSFRGRLAVHAGSKVDREACKRFGYDPDKIPTGAILGTVEVWDVAGFRRRAQIEEFLAYYPKEEREYGNYDLQRFGWRLRDVIKFHEPVTEVRGSLGLWNWNGKP